MKQIKQKRITNYFRSQFEDIVNNYIDTDLIKEYTELKPLLYYNGPRNTRTAFLPEYYALNNSTIPYKKTSHPIDLPDFVKSPYYGCMIYASPEHLSNLLEILGYSTDVAYKLRKKENYYNIFKLNHYGESRDVHDVSFALIEKNAYSGSELKEALNIFEEKHNILGKYIPVIREINGEKLEFLELNFNFSNLYEDFQNLKFDEFKKSIYSSIMQVFPDFEKITLIQADGQSIAHSKHISKDLYFAKLKNTFSQSEQLLLDYFQSKELECIPLSTQEIEAINVMYNNSINKTSPSRRRYALDDFDYKTIDNEYYRTMLYFLYKGPKRKGQTIESYVSNKFDASISHVRLKTPEGFCDKISVAVNRNQDHEFAAKLPIMCDFWTRSGIDKHNQNILYRNYYGEFRNPCHTPFALIKKDYTSIEINELLKELTERYNFSYFANPTKREINGNMEEFSEINIAWFANSNLAKIYLQSFENMEPILNELNTISRDKCIEYELDYYPTYANGQIK